MPREHKFQSPGERDAQFKLLREFGGMNTQAARQAIGEGEFSWLENMQPIGHANLKSVNAISGIKATLTGENITYMSAGNISGTDYMFCFCASGAGYQVNLSTFAKTVIGAAATFGATVHIDQWKNERILIVDAAKYFDWNGAALSTLNGITGAPANGEHVAVFSGRVWISVGRTVYYSAPNSYQDFTGASGGGSFIISDSTLHSSITQMLTTSSFLYIVGSNSFNIVGDVRVIPGTTTTTFANVNVESSIGSTLHYSFFTYYRAIWFANYYGFYALGGLTPKKVSGPLDDGLFKLIDFTKTVTGAAFMLNNILCAGFLFTYNDPAGARPLLAIFFEGKWFVASQSSSITFMAGAQVGGNINLYATDSTGNIYQLFADAAAAISQTLKTKLYDEGNPLLDKQIMKFGLETTLAAGATTITAAIDTEAGSNSATLSSTASGYVWLRAAVSNTGKYFGATLTTSTPGMTVSAAMWEFALGARW